MSDQLIAETSTWQHTTLTTDKYPCPRWDSNPRSQQASGRAARLLRSWVWIPPGAWIFVCCECHVLSGRGLCDKLITRPEGSYRLCCVVVCDLETSRMGAPYIYDISRLRVNMILSWFIYIYIYMWYYLDLYIYMCVCVCVLENTHTDRFLTQAQ